MDSRVTSTSKADAVDFVNLKVHCRVRHDIDDGLLRMFMKAAANQFEEHTSRKILTTGIELQLRKFPGNQNIYFINQRPCPIVLPFPPFQSLASVTYLDSSDQQQTLAGLTTRTGEVFTQINQPTDGWPASSCRGSGDEVLIAYTTGYGDDYKSVPHDLQVSLMVLVDIWYEDREVGDVPEGVKALWGPYIAEPIV